MGMSSAPKKTASRCTTETDTGIHTFEIVGYTLKKGNGLGSFVQSATFTIGGFDWAIRFYPDGTGEASKNCATALLWLLSKNAEVNARYHLRFVRQPAMRIRNATGMVQLLQKMYNTMKNQTPRVPTLFKFADASRYAWHQAAHMSRSRLERKMVLGMDYIHDDRLTIECQLNVIAGKTQVKRVESEIEVPPCDIMHDFGKLLKQKQGADITFNVAGKTFEAHKIVLAARSPVFMAEFYGQMRESGTENVTVEVEDMQPAVFKVLLHFIYNDYLPDLSNLEGNDYSDIMRFLLVAADMYAIERLKLMCQSIIARTLNVENVSSTLALADQHHCDRLKTACIEFIIASSENFESVKATQGYADLKRNFPSTFVELFEETRTKLCRTNTSCTSSTV